MKGQIKTLVSGNFYGFIYANGKQYFFHKSDFQGEWRVLENKFRLKIPIDVEFEPHYTPKGMRASEVRLVE